MKDYQYDVFLSFTGADRDMKNRIAAYLDKKGMKPYDSDLYCAGQFRPDFCEALDRSRVYLMILTDNLRNDPNITGRGCFSEVRREGNLASRLEAAGELNIVILSMSEFFRFGSTFHDYNDVIGWHFYSLTSGFSQIAGEVDADGVLSEKTLDEIASRCRTFVDKRLAGAPVPSQAPRLEIASGDLPEREIFHGREEEIEAAVNAFESGKRAVVLSGLGGVGKTTLAVEIARRLEDGGYLRCPQVVSVRELGERRDGLYTVVSSVSYDKSVYDSLAALSERDRYERKLAALASLPETVLLLIDNYNVLAEENIRTALSKLRCRLLITTRAHILPTSSEIAVIPVDCLGEAAAYGMFSEMLGQEAPYDDFLKLYRFTGGHTITLCIMARLAAAHGIPIAELLGKMDGLASFDARIDFRHNEYGDSDTILGHLSRLFDLSGFDDGCRRILRSMSILGNGTIPLDDLVRILSLPNRNDILTLERSGWLSLSRRETEAGVREYLYLHPIVARLAAGLLLPTEENVPEMIAYLLSSADTAREGLTYADAALLADGLYYACHVLTGSSHRLPAALFSRFTDLDHLLGNAEDTAGKVAALERRLDSPHERARVTAYGDMVTLEQFPMRYEILERYLGRLQENADDYKWVLRALSVTFTHIKTLAHGNAEMQAFLGRALRAAIEAAMAREDDFAIDDLYTYACSVGYGREIASMLGGYLRRGRRTRRLDSAFTMLEYTAIMTRIMNAEEAGNNFKKIGEDRYGWAFLLPLRHPILWGRAAMIQMRFKRLGEDPIALWLKGIVGEATRFVEERQFNARELLERAVALHGARLEHQTTLATAAEAVRGVLNFLQSLPTASVTRATDELVAGVETGDVTVRSLSVLQVATLINGLNGNRAAVEQSRKLVNTVRLLRPDGHNDIFDALIAHAKLCRDFGEREEAFSAYFAVFDRLSEAAPGSSRLAEVAYSILCVAGCPRERLAEVRDAAFIGTTHEDARYYEVINAYLYRLADGEDREERLAAELPELMAALHTAAKDRSASFSVGQTVLYVIDTLIRYFAPEGELRRELLSLIEVYASAPNRILRRAARMQLSSSRVLLAYRDGASFPEFFPEVRRALAMAAEWRSHYDKAADLLGLCVTRMLDTEPLAFPTLLVEDPVASLELGWQRDRLAARLREAEEDGEDAIIESRKMLAARLRPLAVREASRSFGLDWQALRRARTGDALTAAMLGALFETASGEITKGERK